MLFTYFISAVFFYMFFFGTIVETSENGEEWEKLCRKKRPLYMWLFGIILFLTPIINIVTCIFYIGIYVMTYNEREEYNHNERRYENVTVVIIDKIINFLTKKL